jgi:hypothetical protein
MITDFLVISAAVLVSLTSAYILISRDWRYCIAALTIQYIGVFLLVDAFWPIELAVVKMVTGWMVGAILVVAMVSIPDNWTEFRQSQKFSSVFRILTASIFILTITSLVLNSENWLTMINLPIRWGSFFLVGIGLLQLSLTSHPMRVVIGLLTALSGFEIIYAAVETSTLVSGLLAGVNLGLALVCAYLLIAPSMEANR